MRKDTEKHMYVWPLFVCTYAVSLLLLSATTPITPREAYLYFEDSAGVVSSLMHAGEYFFAREFGSRLFFLGTALLNAFLFYKITPYFFEKKEDRLLALFFYLMLPGVILSSVLANIAVLVSLAILLFLYSYLSGHKWIAILPLVFLGFLHWSALYIYAILLLYGLFQKKKEIFLLAIGALICYTFLGSPPSLGDSRNHFLEIFGIYAMVFSPPLFIYLFYALYRGLLRGDRDLLWYFSFGALFVSLALSFQARIRITDFGSYLMLGVIPILRIYHSSLRVRLPVFQHRYKVLFWIVTSGLLLSASSLIFHQPLYALMGQERYPLLAPIYEPYKRAKGMYGAGKICWKKSDRKMKYQMKYYGCNKCFQNTQF